MCMSVYTLLVRGASPFTLILFSEFYHLLVIVLASSMAGH